ncbi:hypothetical protein IE077_002645, partial [Cardiosporidium cionae]
MTVDVPSRQLLSANRNLQAGLSYNYRDSIRIAFYNDSLADIREESPSDYNLIYYEFLHAVAQKLSDTFRVERVTENFGLARVCRTVKFIPGPDGRRIRACNASDANIVGRCIGTPIPEGLYTEDIFVCYPNDTCIFKPGNAGFAKADLGVIIRADTTPDCSGNRRALAFAGTCVRDGNTDRPLLASLTLCQSLIRGMRSNRKLGVDTLLHEILHGMGFSISSFILFRYDNGTARISRNSFGRPTGPSNTTYMLGVPIGPRGQTSSYIVTETAKEYARNYFGCDTALGISIENQGGAGSALSHVERTSFFEDTMVAIGGVDGILSNGTLAILRDSGWYNIEFNQAGNPQWGYKDFSNNQCNMAGSLCFDETSTDDHSFCFSTGNRCSYDLTSINDCGFFNRDYDVPARFQYFDDPRKGGYEFTNFCPTTAHGTVRDSCMPLDIVCDYDFCRSGRDKNFDNRGGIHGLNSRCFESSLTRIGLTSAVAPTCYETECVATSEFS